MDYKKTAEAIKLCGSTPKVDQCKRCVYWSGGDMSECIPRMTEDAATAITDLLSRAEDAEARAESLEMSNRLLSTRITEAEARCTSLDEARENANEACAKWEGMYRMALERAEKAEKRINAIEDILGDDYDLDRLSVMMNQCMSMRDEVAERFRLTAKIPLDRLKDLVEADRDGRCVVLPCKVGKTVYMPFCNEVVEKRIGQFHINGYTSPRIWADIDCDWATTQRVRWDLAFGKTVFLSREAAEAALKGERDG